MSADLLLDHLVQQGLLDTDENTFLLDKCRAVKCDFILCKLLHHPEHQQDFMKLIPSEEGNLNDFGLCAISPHLLCAHKSSTSSLLEVSYTVCYYNFFTAYSLKHYITERNFRISFRNFLTYTSFLYLICLIFLKSISSQGILHVIIQKIEYRCGSEDCSSMRKNAMATNNRLLWRSCSVYCLKSSNQRVPSLQTFGCNCFFIKRLAIKSACGFSHLDIPYGTFKSSKLPPRD
jgi:hypothetical protein